jgi:hypothetical protein
MLTTPPTTHTPSRPKKEVRKQKETALDALQMHERRSEFGYDGCYDELGEPEFGLELGLVDVNAVLLVIYRYSLPSTLLSPLSSAC